MGLDIYLRYRGKRLDGDDYYVRISGSDYSFRDYVRQKVFHTPEGFPSDKDPCFQPDWIEAYQRLLMWLNSNSSKNGWTPACLTLMKWCWEVINTVPEDHQIEWWE